MVVELFMQCSNVHSDDGQHAAVSMDGKRDGQHNERQFERHNERHMNDRMNDNFQCTSNEHCTVYGMDSSEQCTSK